jgi:hypothetical protein
MSPRRQWSSRSSSERDWRTAWARTARRRRVQEAAREAGGESTTAADLAVQESPSRVIPEEAVLPEVRTFLDDGGLERWAEREQRVREQDD